MDSNHKLACVLFVCLTIVILAVVAGVTVYQVSIDAKAIDAGMERQRAPSMTTEVWAYPKK